MKTPKPKNPDLSRPARGAESQPLRKFIVATDQSGREHLTVFSNHNAKATLADLNYALNEATKQNWKLSVE